MLLFYSMPFALIVFQLFISVFNKLKIINIFCNTDVVKKYSGMEV